MKSLRDFIYEAVEEEKSKNIEVTAETVAEENDVELGDVNKVVSYLKDNADALEDLSEDTLKDAEVENDDEDYMKKLLKAVKALKKGGFFDDKKDDDKDDKDSDKKDGEGDGDKKDDKDDKSASDDNGGEED